ncbi:MAG: hypothetical protein QGG64_14450 [Candidatus Latescibacteria bacterium]|jgi:hypothetical protein|nr:hypothetical protein [Candidatus Latescibacterota bacterium]
MSIVSTLSIDQEEQKPEQNYAAYDLSASHRQDLAIQVMGRTESVSSLSRHHGVSRKFLYAQAEKAHIALTDAFSPSSKDDAVLFYLPVTKAWLRQLVMALVLICHASYRGVVELFGDMLDTSISVGSVHNILTQAVVHARTHQAQEDLSAIRVGAHDEIFQNGKPVLTGCDLDSSYCYLLGEEESRDTTSWGVHLLDLQERGLDLDYTLADFGKGLRAGQAEAWPGVPCRGDIFHLMQDLTKMTTYLENRALSAMAKTEKLEKQMRKAKKKVQGHKLSKKLAQARLFEQQAVSLADEIRLLSDWLSQDILSMVGPPLETRQELYDFVVEELQARQAKAPHRIDPVVRKLKNGREELLAFAKEMDQRLLRLARQYQIAPQIVRQLFLLQDLPRTHPARWQQEADLRALLGQAFYPVQIDIQHIMASTYRASSVVENLNSRLRNYFFLRKHLGNGYLDLLRFFLNHRRFQRSERPERVGKSPAEILSGKEHPHWLNLLGFQPFKKAA